MDPVIITPYNPMKNDCRCLACALVDVNNAQELAELYSMFSPGNIITSNENRELPVYPDLDSLVKDIIEADFNNDIDKTYHFDMGDIDNLFIFEVSLLGDASPTSKYGVYIAKAFIVLGMLDIDQIRTELRLKALSMGKMPQDGNKTAWETQKEEHPDEEPDYNSILEKYDMERVYAHLAEAKDPSKIDIEGKFGIVNADSV